jgi:hypothetical protein
MTHAIVPPYLLARIAAAQDLKVARAARAAEATLASPYEQNTSRQTLDVESVPAMYRTISDARGSETLVGESVRGEDDPQNRDEAIDES